MCYSNYLTIKIYKGLDGFYAPKTIRTPQWSERFMRIWIDVGRVFFSLCPFVPTWISWENCAGMKGCGLSPFKVFSRFWSGSWSLFLIGSYGSEWSGHTLLSHPLSQPIRSAKRALQRQLNSCWCKARWLHYEDRFLCPKQDRWGCLFI